MHEPSVFRKAAVRMRNSSVCNCGKLLSDTPRVVPCSLVWTLIPSARLAASVLVETWLNQWIGTEQRARGRAVTSGLEFAFPQRPDDVNR